MPKLHEALAAKGLMPDVAQTRALNILQSLYDELLKPPARTLLGRRKIAAVKGVYMYGGVGRGKSMLMDLFHDSLPSSVKHRRIHFHEFMISVHDFLHQARQTGKAVNGPDRALLDFADKIAADRKSVV